MKSFSKNVSLDAFRASVERHLELDHLLQGTYRVGSGENFRGCHVGCCLHDFIPVETSDYVDDPHEDHKLYEKLFGLPRHLALLFDIIHENIDEEHTPEFLQDVAAVLQAGVDYRWIYPQLILRFITDEQRALFPAAVNLFERWADGHKPRKDSFRKQEQELDALPPGREKDLGLALSCLCAADRNRHSRSWLGRSFRELMLLHDDWRFYYALRDELLLLLEEAGGGTK